MDPTPLIGPGRDESREYTPDEDQRLARNLEALIGDLYAGAFAPTSFLLDLLELFHRRLFDGVRTHAGRIRDCDRGTEVLVFGPNRSVHRSEVRNQLEKVLRECERSLASFDANPAAVEYEEAAVHMAVWVHAEIIRIHPFEDGNGRTSRVMMNWILLRLGLRAIPFDAVRQEYATCLNVYHQIGDLGPIRDLAIRCYPV